MYALRRTALLLAALALAAPQLRARAATKASAETAGDYPQRISSTQETHIEGLRKACPPLQADRIRCTCCPSQRLC